MNAGIVGELCPERVHRELAIWINDRAESDG